MNHDPYARKDPYGGGDPYAKGDAYSNNGNPYARKEEPQKITKKSGNGLLYVFLAAVLGVAVAIRFF